MKRILNKTALLLAAVLLFTCLISPAAQAEAKRLRIVTTVFPPYDWLRQVLGERIDMVDLHLLQDSGVDLHNFQPTAKDMMVVSSADLVVYIGGISDYWVPAARAEAVNKSQVEINLLQALGDAVKAEVLVEGMQDAEHGHETDAEHEDDAGHETDSHEELDEDVLPDEHVWLSMRNAQALVRLLADRLGELDPQYAAMYRENASAYIDQLALLDQQYAQAVAAAPARTLLFADRFPFRYLTDDYGLQYYAAFSGCSAETEASFETITFLSGKVDELNLRQVLVLENARKRLAETIIANTAAKDQRIITMDSMQSVNREDIDAGATYLGIMIDNLESLKAALQQAQ